MDTITSMRALEYKSITDAKQKEFFGGTFGVNRKMPLRQKIPQTSEMIYDAFGLYFNWVNGIENDEERVTALLEGEFALRDIQTTGATELYKDDPDFVHYNKLLIRGNRVDTIEYRRRVFGKIASLVIDARDAQSFGNEHSNSGHALEHSSVVSSR